jgi:Phage integrase, N-terminal SAM-like domain
MAGLGKRKARSSSRFLTLPVEHRACSFYHTRLNTFGPSPQQTRERPLPLRPPSQRHAAVRHPLAPAYPPLRRQRARALGTWLALYSLDCFFPKARGLRHESSSEWLDTWLWEYKKPRLRPSSFDSYEMLVRCHLKPALGHIVLQDVGPEHLQRFYNEKMQQGSSARTVRYCHTLLHGALAQAEKHQLLIRNVSKLTELPPEARKEMHTIISTR